MRLRLRVWVWVWVWVREWVRVWVWVWVWGGWGDPYSFVVGKGRGCKLLQVSGVVEEKFSHNFVHLCFRVFCLGIVH